MSSDVIDVRQARVRFRTPEEGGRQTAPASGVRSHIELGEFQTSCVVDSIAGLEVLPLGEETDVRIRVLFADHVGTAFARATSVELYEGSKLVATGAFLDQGQS